jgi:hypothetical protein
MPDGLTPERLYLRAGSDVHVVDLASGKVIFAADLPYDEGLEIVVTPDGDVLTATGTSLYLWHPGDAELAVAPLPLPAGASPTALRLSADGTQVAIGTAMGAVVHAPLAEVRAAPRLPVNLSPDPCVLGGPKLTSFASLSLVETTPTWTKDVPGPAARGRQAVRR